jgi:signal transduction histidine kinase
MPRKSCADDLARACVQAQTELRRAGRALHDEIGSLLAVAGVRLQLLRMDLPDLAERTHELGEVLDRAMEAVRALSQDLDPSPVRRLGLKNALLGLAKRHREARRLQVTVRSTVRSTMSGALPPEVAEVIYQAASHAIMAAAGRPDVTRIRITAAGTRSVTVRVADNGKPGPNSSLAMAAMLARHAGLGFEMATGKGTIVSIRYALRRPSGG